MRLGAQDNRNKGYDSAAIIGLDVTSDGILDFYIGVEVNCVGKGNEKFDIGIYQFPAGADSPNTTTLTSPDNQIYGYEQSATNFDWSPVYEIDNYNQSNPLADIDGQGNLDYYLTVAVPFIDLQAAINGTAGYEGFDETTPISFVAITSQNLNQINNDFNGIDDNATSLNAPYGGVGEPGDPDYVPGAGSVPYTPESTEPLEQVPEPANYGLILATLSLIGVLWRRAYWLR